MEQQQFYGYRYIFSFILLTVAVPASAQDDITSIVNYTPHFLICILAGLILAMGFQLLLTMTSVATGISFIPNFERNKNHLTSTYTINHPRDEKESRMPIGIKISSSIGLWTMLTASISLFFACLLAVKLSLVDNSIIGVVLGLVIWASFFIILSYLEMKSVTSLLGGIFNMAFKGIRNSLETLFGKSKEGRISGIIDQSLNKIRKDLTDAADQHKLGKKIDKYIDKLQPRELNLEQIRKEIAKLLEDIQIEEQSQIQKLGFEKRHFIRIAEKESHLSFQDIKKLAKVFMEVYAVSKLAAPLTEKIISAAGKISRGNEGNIASFREKIEDYLRRTGREELKPENLKNDIEQILHHPKETKEILSNRIKSMDRSTLIALLAQRKDIGQEEAVKITDQIMKAVEFIKDKLGLDGHAKREFRDGFTNENIEDFPEEKSSLMEKLESRIRIYLNSLERPEFNYEGIKRDFEQLFHDRKSGYELLKYRLSLYDKDSLVAILSSKENISKDDAERMVNKILEAKENVLKKLNKIEEQAKLKMEEARTFALHEAEQTRKTTVAAAWWLIATSIVSGIAAALGGMAG